MQDIQTKSKIRTIAELMCPVTSGVVTGVYEYCLRGQFVHVGDPLLAVMASDGQSMQDIASDVKGVILDVHVKEGDGVTPNTILATVDVSRGALQQQHDRKLQQLQQPRDEAGLRDVRDNPPEEGDTESSSARRKALFNAAL